MKKLLPALLILVLCGCQEEVSDPLRDEPQAPRLLQKYLAAQAAGDWNTVCNILAPAEQKSIQQTTGRSCAKALQEQGDTLQKIAENSELLGIERQGSVIRADLENPRGELWIKGNHIYFTAP